MARTKFTDADIERGLMLNPPGSAEWRKWYVRYRQTEHWQKKAAEKLRQYPFCQLEWMMGRKRVHAEEVHHASYDHWFKEGVVTDLVSVTERNHQLWTNRNGRRR